MRWPKTIVWSASFLALASGCRNCDRVEEALRAREEDLRQVREELGRTSAYSQALEYELRSERGLGPHDSPLTTSPVRNLMLGRATGGHDQGTGYDNGLQVQLVPRDADGHAVKVPGSAYIEAYEISPEGIKSLLSNWDVPHDLLSDSWRAGLLSTGYNLILPWKSPPFSENLRLVARFRLADGRTFEAEKDIKVRIPADRTRRMPKAEDGATLPHPKPAPSPLPEIKEQGPPVVLPKPRQMSDPPVTIPPLPALPLPPVDPVKEFPPPAVEILQPVIPPFSELVPLDP
jgi:hypothetical protein